MRKFFNYISIEIKNLILSYLNMKKITESDDLRGKEIYKTLWKNFAANKEELDKKISSILNLP